MSNLDNTDWGFHLYPVSCPIGVLRFKQGTPYWLHKSTEACTEIMVRVLWPNGVYVQGGQEVSGGIESQCWIDGPTKHHDPDDMECISSAIDADPMQSFRTAVLRALCENEN